MQPSSDISNLELPHHAIFFLFNGGQEGEGGGNLLGVEINKNCHVSIVFLYYYQPFSSAFFYPLNLICSILEFILVFLILHAFELLRPLFDILL